MRTCLATKNQINSFQNTSEIVDSMIPLQPGKWTESIQKFNGWFRCMDLKRGTTSLVFQVVGWLSIINQFGYQGSVAYEKLQANSFGQGVNRQETRWSWKRYCPWIHRQWKWLYRIIIEIVMDDKSTNKWTESHWRIRLIRPQHARWRAEVRFIREPHCRFKQDYASYWVVRVRRIGLWSMLLTVSSWR